MQKVKTNFELPCGLGNTPSRKERKTIANLHHLIYFSPSFQSLEKDYCRLNWLVPLYLSYL